MERPGVRITRLCPIIVQFFLRRELVSTISILECLRVSTFGPLWLRPFGNAFLPNSLVSGIGHSKWPWTVHVCTSQACCPRLEKAWNSFFTKHISSPRVLDQLVTLQQEWDQFSNQFGGRFLSPFLRGWAHSFTWMWLGTLSTLFFDLQLRTILWCMLLNTPYSRSEIASLNGWMSPNPTRVGGCCMFGKPARLEFGGHFPSPCDGKTQFSRNARDFFCNFLGWPKADCRLVLWSASARVGCACSNNAVTGSPFQVSD